ncbi:MULTISPECIES: YycH family regulatory protein [Lysinibacillus]|uniref:Regulatory protein YycH domain-containing protein n=1 Tax=Lysinibacillus antri TaxID=2498145 RepID=A0A3S0P2Q1_9BACI|nr:MULTISPECIES: two-component system activity regulator YycH [Lysinibacillus]RUL49439.1 hypothetical protein EK386_15190 [Lysinibacillus antri]TSI11096.1 hypothetical protein FJQ64_02670 [Lysinibacillus sp. BW-2-10]
MGLKYVEQIKSVVLALLVILSILLTFSIWSYTPNYQPIEESQVEQILVDEQKELHQVIKPFRVLVTKDNSLSGTISSRMISDIMSTISNLRATELKFIQNNLTEEKINSIIQTNERISLFFPAEVPINTLRSILEFSQNELPEVSFKYLVMDWSNFQQTRMLKLFFISGENRTLYSTDVAISDEDFNSTFNEIFKQSVPYKEIKRDEKLSLYVPVNPVEVVQYTYVIDQVSPEKFKEVLFKDPNIVKRNIESATSSKYTDGMAFMTSETNTKTINYVYPASESIIDIKGSKLLQNSFDFINEHGGLTGDYRYVYRNIPKQITEYQLFLKGVPVYSSITSTRISTTWGDNQIFRYKRPYYSLDMDIASETQQLPPGERIVETLENLNDIDDIFVGYFLVQNDELLYTLEPSWFVIHNGGWTRIMSESVGGLGYGLE